MRALITGITGFVGPYLKDHLLEKGFEVFGFDRYGKEFKGATVYQADLLDKENVFSIINKVKPDYIFHLAAQSSVEKSFEMPKITMDININGTKNILDGVLKSKINPTILIVTSAQVYGIPKKIPINEEQPPQSNSPYAESRIKQEELVSEYIKNYGLNIIISRSFNHTGPGQPPIFVCPEFAKQIAEIEKGLKKPVISIGNLDVKRDFSDVRDIVKAYVLAVEKGKPGQVYNICSNKSYSIKEILNLLLSMSNIKIKIIEDPKKKRAIDIPILMGDNSKFKNQTGWQPEISFESTLKDILEYWRKSV